MAEVGHFLQVADTFFRAKQDQGELHGRGITHHASSTEGFVPDVTIAQAAVDVDSQSMVVTLQLTSLITV